MKTILDRLAARPKFLLVATAFFVSMTITIDQVLKAWAVELLFPVDFLFLRFQPVGNPGIFGGYLADLDPWIVRIFFSVLFGFLAIGIALTFYFLRHKSTPILKMGLVVYVAGIFGNVWDRMTTGAVVDYAIVRIPGLSGMAFNFADGVVFVGAILIAVAVFREADALWYAKDQRKGYWIEPGFQWGFGLWLVLLGFAHFVVIALYSFVFLKAFVGSSGAPKIPADQIIRDYLFGLSVIEGAALLLTFAASVIFSHRLVGPLFAFRQYVERRKSGGDSEFKLRSGDYFKSFLEGLAKKI